MENKPLSDELLRLEDFFANRIQREPAWPEDSVALYTHVISQLQQWFEVTSAAQSFSCAPLIPKIAEFLLTIDIPEIVCSMILDCTFVGDPKNSLTLRVLAGGYFDWTSVMVAKLVAMKTDCIIEAGANIGTETIPFAKLVPDGQVLAIEADQRNARWIERNIALNQFTNIRLTAAPASDRAERLSVAGYNEHNTGLAHVIESTDDGTDTVTLDQCYAEQANPRSVSYLHLDVEGFETKVLHGAENVIHNHRPWIYAEAQRQWLERAGSSVGELFQTLTNYGYTIHRFHLPTGSLMQLNTATVGGVVDENWLAVPNDNVRHGLLDQIAETYHQLSQSPESFQRFFDFRRNC